MFYHGNETDPENKSMEPVMSFKPFRDFFASWMPPGITDKDYVIAQYDGAIAYMDACIQTIFTALEAHGVLDETIVVINGDHGETLYDHECWFDHHGIYDNVLRVPLIIRYPGAVPKARSSAASISTKTWCRRFCNWPAFRPTTFRWPQPAAPDARRRKFARQRVLHYGVHLDAQARLAHAGMETHHCLGAGLPLQAGSRALQPRHRPGRKPQRGRTEPRCGAVSPWAHGRAHRAARKRKPAFPNPIHHQGDWHGHEGLGAFTSSQQAYDTLHIGDPDQAAKLQAKSRD
jgi:hypothetical protein